MASLPRITRARRHTPSVARDSGPFALIVDDESDHHLAASVPPVRDLVALQALLLCECIEATEERGQQEVHRS
jgi:hypothetical protein